MAASDTSKEASFSSDLDFCTLGMFIIDEIHFKPPTPSVYNILGGAGSYSALGARLLSPKPLSKRVGWVVDRGSEFPAELSETLEKWDTSVRLRDDPNRLTTRGWNGYGENEHRAFRYTTAKLRLTHEDLDDRLLRSKAFHLICSPARCIELVEGIMARRKQIPLGSSLKRPYFIWEPVPDLCIPSELDNCFNALSHVDVVSPNHAELAGFFGKTATKGEDVDKQVVEACADYLLTSGIGDGEKGAVVVRCGKEGCFVVTKDYERWIPAYHQDAEKVVDPTGGGNGFLGGFAVGLVRGSGELKWAAKIEKAVIWGTIAASFAIEQVGMPKLEIKHDGGETWNGVRVFDRISEFKERLEKYVQP